MSEHQHQTDPTLIWAPGVIENVSSLELELYLKFAATACIPGGGCNLEEALAILYKCQGDIKEATRKLLIRETKEAVVWTLEEVQLFEHLFRIYPKNFTSISRDLKTKSVKDCVEFYYLWKHQNQNQNQQLLPSHHYAFLQQSPPTPLALVPKLEDPELGQHQILIYQPQAKLEELPNVIIHPQQESPQELSPDQESFPCKVCGRVFLKIKSRSAHMKRHKNERLYNLS